jgi:hypothetical protein
MMASFQQLSGVELSPVRLLQWRCNMLWLAVLFLVKIANQARRPLQQLNGLSARAPRSAAGCVTTCTPPCVCLRAQATGFPRGYRRWLCCG